MVTATNSWNMLGSWTRQGSTGYLCIDRWPGHEAVIPLVKTKAVSAKLLATGRPLQIRQEYNGRLIISGLPTAPPDAISVIAAKFAGPPHRINESDCAAWLSGKAS